MGGWVINDPQGSRQEQGWQSINVSDNNIDICAFSGGGFKAARGGSGGGSDPKKGRSH